MTTIPNLVQTEFDAYLTKPYLSSEDTQRLDLLAYVLGVTVTIKRTYFSTGWEEIVTLPDLAKPYGEKQDGQHERLHL